MTKPDYSRDYYADLELPPTADVNDVKKQFRKLALKYHPDRNPGREAEVNAKFQTIQAASEILGSPEQKSKYDAHRARHSRFPTASGMRGNPWANAGKDFPPPPQRNRPNMSSRATGPSASAARYAKFPMNPPPVPPRAAEDPKSRADAFESFRPPRRAPTAAAADPNPYATRSRAPEPKYTPTQQKKADASFGNRTSRSARSGFVPGSPLGDEPPVTSKNYMNKRHTSLFDDAPAAGPPPVPPRQANEDFSSGAEDFPPNLGPRSSPYQSRSGERLNLNPAEGTANIGRAKSTRVPQPARPDHDGDPFVTPSDRQRSFSVSGEPQAARQNASSQRSAGSSAHTGTIPHTSRFGERYTPKAETGSFFGRGAQDNAASSGAGNAVPGVNEEPKLYDVADPYVNPSLFPFEASPERPNKHPKATASDDRQPPGKKRDSVSSASNLDEAWLSSGALKSTRLNLNTFERSQLDQLKELLAKSSQAGKPQRRPPIVTPKYHWADPASHTNLRTNKAGTSFGSTNGDTEYGRFTGNRAESINTRFVAEDHANTNWQFNAGVETPQNANGSAARRPQVGGRIAGRRSPTKGTRPTTRSGAGLAAGAAAAAAAATAAGFAAGDAASSTEDLTGSSTPSQKRHQAGFDADVWSDQIGSEHFVPAPARGSVSPTRGPRSAKRRPAVRMTKGGSAGMVEEEDTTSGEDQATGASLNSGVQSPSAMDIDMEDPPPAPQPAAEPTTGVRGVPLEPSRPEWRAGDANGFTATTAAAPAPASAPAVQGLGLNLGPAPPTIPPKVPISTPQFNTSNVAGSEDTDSFGLGFSEFKNVEPLAQRPTGLGSFDDLKSTLPFESRASVKVPVEKTEPESLWSKPAGGIALISDMPQAPLPPPSLLVPNLGVEKAVWDKYAAEFEAYLRECTRVKTELLSHLYTRERRMTKLLESNNSLTELVSGHMREYMALVEWDQKVHEKWTAYNEDHLQRVKEFVTLKERLGM